MKEQDFLKNFAKILGADKELEEIQKKEDREKRLLESLSKHIGAPVDFQTEDKEVPETLVSKVQPIVDTETTVLTEDVVIELAEEVKLPEPIREVVVQPMPTLPPEITTPVIDKTPSLPVSKKQKEEDGLPIILRKEIDAIKKSITDFHRFAQRHSQMGGGGEVNLRYLDDVDRSSIGDGKYLYYDGSTKKFSFNSLSGGGAPQVQSNWSETDNTAVSFIQNKPDLTAYQTAAGLSANVAVLSSNNSAYLGGIAAAQYAYANATFSSLVNGSDTLSLNGASKVELPGGTAYIFSATNNITLAPDNTGSNYLEIINNVGITVSTDRGFDIRTNVDGTDKVWSFTQGGSLFFPDSTYQTTAWTGSVATLTANNTSFVGTVSAANVVSNNQLQSNLANYQTTAGLSANVATLTSNNSLYLGGIAAAQYAYANQIVTYTLPTANTTSLGGVKIDGTTITITDGVISSPNQDLSGYQTTAGLSANVATLSSNNSSYLGGVAAASYAKLSTNVAFGSVTSNTATAFIAGIAANSGVALQMPHEGALRNMSTTSSTMYFDTSNGGSAHGNFNFRSSNNFTSILHLGVSQITFNSGAAISGQTPYAGRTSFNVALDTVVTVDNLKYRISNQGGVFPQVASASGSTADVCYSGIGYINGATNPATAHNSGYILAADGTWLSLYSTHGMDDRGDLITFHVTDKSAGKIYRVTFLVTNNSSNVTGYNIVVERVI